MYGGGKQQYYRPYPQQQQFFQRKGKEVEQVTYQIDTVCMQSQVFLKHIFTPISLTLLLAAGWLPFCVKAWEPLMNDQWVLQVIRGYKLELMATRFQQAEPAAVVTSSNQELVAEEVQKLLEKGAVKAVDRCPDQFVSRIFLVPKKDDSFRPVINLRPLNQFMATSHFKMESLAMLRDLLRPGDWMASVDLKDAYLSVVIWEGH